MSMRGMIITDTVKMVTEECCNCGTLFAVTEQFQRECLDNHGKWFYCPNGHRQHYTGKTDEQKAKERAAELERRLASRDEDLRAARMQRDEERRRHAATKGQLTKTKRRIAHGVCPCCGRTFANVARHMAGRHPDYVEAAGS